VLERLAEVFDRMQGKHRVIVDALRGGWTPDSADALIQSLDGQARWLSALLRDPERCQVSWVTLPEDMASRETEDGLRALEAEQITVDRVIVNRMSPAPRRPCEWCDGRRRIESTALRALQRRLRGSDVSIASVPAVAIEPRGTRALAALMRHLSAEAAVDPPLPAGRRRRLVASLAATTQAVERSALMPPGTALVLVGGKGGVGKTTCAAALAVDTALASPDRRVLLLSADPAHSLGDVLRRDVADDPRPFLGGPANLSVRELDPIRGFAALRHRFASGIEELMLRVGGSTGDRQVLRDVLELAPPGVDELVAIVEVIETLDASAGRATFDLIVIDTAPTGHALRLLEMPALVHDWVKAVMSILLKYQPAIGVGDLGAALLRLSRGLAQLRALLTNAARTRFLVVTRAAALPRAETVRLLARLEAAGVPAPVVVVNAVRGGTCTRCRSEAAREHKEIAALVRGLPVARGRRRSLILAPATMPPPSGWRDLRSFFREWRQLAPRDDRL
jgi:arsenite-transporting ATPase